jgi:hypothetical protein
MGAVLTVMMAWLLWALPVVAQTLNRAHMGIVNPLEYGTACNSTTLGAAASAIGGVRATLMLTATDRAGAACTWSITGSVTIPANITLWVPHGAAVTLSGGQTLTLAARPIEEYLTWWSGTGKVVFTTVGPDRTGVCSVKDPLFGAVGDGSTDDTAAIAAALASTLCDTILFPHGAYRVSSTLTITKGQTLSGAAAGAGGATTAGYLGYRGAAIEHNFNGTLFQISGTNGSPEVGVGVTFQNMILRQVYGNNTAASGIAINVVTTSDSYHATWVKVRDITIEKDAAKDDWTWGLVFDGNGASSTVAVGSRDHQVNRIRINCATNCTGAIKLRATANVTMSDLLINGVNGDIDISGSDAGHTSFSTTMSNVLANGTLRLGYATTVLCAACGFERVIGTGNTAGLVYMGTVNTPPTLPFGSSQNIIYSGGTIYTGGQNALTLRAIDTGQSHLDLDGAGGSSTFVNFQSGAATLWALGRAGTTGTFFLNGPSGVSDVLTGTLAGGMAFGYAMTKKHRTLTYASPVSVDASQGNVFNLSILDASNITINAPSGTLAGQEIAFRIFNSSGGAMGTITWQSVYHLAGAFTNPANGYNRTITFVVQDAAGGTLFESHRTAADVSN